MAQLVLFFHFQLLENVKCKIATYPLQVCATYLNEPGRMRDLLSVKLDVHSAPDLLVRDEARLVRLLSGHRRNVTRHSAAVHHDLQVAEASSLTGNCKSVRFLLLYNVGRREVLKVRIWGVPWWAATVATYCPSKPGELPKFSSSKPHD